MLDAFIIEEIKRRERLRQQHDERPVVELPLPKTEDRPKRRSEPENDEKPQRSVVVIDMC